MRAPSASRWRKSCGSGFVQKKISLSRKRVSAPWPPIAGKCDGAKSPSRSAIGRPLTKASAPFVRTNNRLSVSSNPGASCTSTGDGPMSTMVPSTSSKRAIFCKSSWVKTSITGSLAIVCTTIIPSGTRKFGRGAHSAGEHLNISVDSGDDLEFALVDFPFVARDGAVFTLGKNHARKGTDGFLDDVAARREHRPRGVGTRLAAAVAHQLERDGR